MIKKIMDLIVKHKDFLTVTGLLLIGLDYAFNTTDYINGLFILGSVIAYSLYSEYKTLMTV